MAQQGSEGREEGLWSLRVANLHIPRRGRSKLSTDPLGRSFGNLGCDLGTAAVLSWWFFQHFSLVSALLESSELSHKPN